MRISIQRLQGWSRLTLTVVIIAVVSSTLAAAAESAPSSSVYQSGVDPLNKLKALQDAAANRDPEACYQLALRYERGEGVARDRHRAATYLERAAHLGHALAAYTLSEYYASGKKGAIDLVSAYYWLALAMESGQASAQPSFDALSRRMTKPQLLEAQLRVAETLRQRERQETSLPTYDKHGAPVRAYRSVHWTMKAAENGDGEMQFKLAVNLLNGYDNFSKNRAAALRWYRSSAEKGWVPAQYVFGSQCLSDGNLLEGLKWLRAAARQGHLESQRFLAVILSNGQYGVPRNYQESLRWLKLAADQNDAQAQEMLGRRYEAGTGTPQDIGLAWYWYERASNSNHAECAYRVARRFEFGDAPEKDEARAYGWYLKADTLGYPCAKSALQTLKSRLSQSQLATAELLWTEWQGELPNARPKGAYSVDCP